MTWEHLVAKAHRGSDKISNLRVAHQKCNSLVGHLRVDVKLALHDLGRLHGSDAFFRAAMTLSRLAPGALAMSGKIPRRPRRTAAPLPFFVTEIMEKAALAA